MGHSREDAEISEGQADSPTLIALLRGDCSLLENMAGRIPEKKEGAKSWAMGVSIPAMGHKASGIVFILPPQLWREGPSSMAESRPYTSVDSPVPMGR